MLLFQVTLFTRVTKKHKLKFMNQKLVLIVHPFHYKYNKINTQKTKKRVSILENPFGLTISTFDSTNGIRIPKKYQKN